MFLLKGLIILFSLVLSTSVWSQSTNWSNWVTFESRDGAFTMAAPSEPEYLVKEITTSIGAMELHSYMVAPQYDDQNPNLMYLIEYYDYPEGTFPEDSTALKLFFYEQTAQATSYEIGGALSYSSESSVDGIDGFLYRCQYKNDAYVMKSRMFFVGDRFYHIKVYSEKESSLNDEMDWYLDSFKLK